MIRNSLTLITIIALVLAIQYGLAQLPGPAIPAILVAGILLLFLWRPLWIRYGRGRL